MATQFESVPNVTRVVGSDNEELVTQKLLVADEGVTIMARGGVVGGPRDVELSYDEIQAVDHEGEYTFDLVLETAANTYTVTNVTADRSEITAMIDFVCGRLGGRTRPSRSQTASDGSGVTNGRRPADGSGTADSGGSGGSDGSDGGDVTEQLRKFAELRDDGIISEEEFERKKQELLE
jgi:hypothetical protein